MEKELSEVLSTAEEIAEHYTAATGITCTVVDIRDDISVFDSVCSLCFCRTVGKADTADAESSQNHSQHSPQGFSQLCSLCRASHFDSCRLSERFGGSYIYFCRLSLMFWVSPVIHDGVMQEAYAAGPVRVLDDAEILQDAESIEELHLEDAEKRKNFIEQLQHIPKIDIARTRSLSEVLRMCAAWTSGYFEQQLLENQTYIDQQSRISEYIQEIKKRFAKQDNEQNQTESYYPIELEHQLLSAISRGDRQQAQALLNEILGSIFFASGNRIDLIRFRVQELIVLLSRAAIDGGAIVDEVLKINDQCQQELNKFVSLEAIAYWLSKVLKQYVRLVFSARQFKHVSILEQVLQYIHLHHTEKVTLQDAAVHVGLSPTYLSRIFNEEMGCSFTYYLNQNRIDHAKTLLRTTRYTLVFIAGAVGFDDQSYFSKIFKHHTGITPGKYRERAGHYPTDKNEIHR